MSSVPSAQATPAAVATSPVSRLRQFAAPAAVLLLAILLWAPRWSGPLDLRFDAGVYYLLGTSLSEGMGYRLLNEPGAISGIQYPPFLPLLVAVHQWVLRTTDAWTVASAMRTTYAVIFLLYALAVFMLARRWLTSWPAAAATALCLLSLHTYFLSDLLFAELPFALVSVVFVLVATAPGHETVPRRRTWALFALGSTAFFLRTAGLALFAGWALEALLRRQWRQLALRIGLAALPFAAWQGYIWSVKAHPTYTQPHYSYQRAPYQFYNVTYSENLELVDPFQPELGYVGIGDVIHRVFDNMAAMPRALAEASSLQHGYWRRPIGRFQERLFGKRFWLDPLAAIPVVAFTLLVPLGLVLLAWRRSWILVGIVVATVGLVCLTPWPGQFQRYLSPLAPFLTLAVVLALLFLRDQCAERSPGTRRWVTGLVGLLLVTTLLAQTWTARRLFQVRNEEGRTYVSAAEPHGPGLFFHDEGWREWEQAAEWINLNTPTQAVVATSSPHLLHILTNRMAVMPPMEVNPTRARELLAEVPVTHVIVDSLEFIDISRRYALPALAEAPEVWRVVHTIGNTQIYAFIDSGAKGGGSNP